MESLDAALPALIDDLPFELAALARAQNYQKWVFDTVEPFLGRRILEIGAGIGNMSRWLPSQERLILSECDPNLIDILQKTLASDEKRASNVVVRSFDFMNDPIEPFCEENLDTILSFNVLEHVEDDLLALDRLCRILRSSHAPGPKRLVTFVPAHNWAYGSFDRHFGHYRRYSYTMFERLAQKVAPETRIEARYFNLIGLLGWIINGKILSKSTIGPGAIQTFERLCPYVRGMDDFIHTRLRFPLGQSLLFVLTWE